jgi:hypothetical protein
MFAFVCLCCPEPGEESLWLLLCFQNGSDTRVCFFLNDELSAISEASR